MKKLVVELEHCYGIKRLQTEFDFDSCGSVFAVYAPNGVMKTSFANTFRDLSQEAPSSDRIWPTRATKRVIVDEFGVELSPSSVFVIEPYNGEYRSERISTLLVNETLRLKYEGILKDIDARAEALVAQIKPRAGLKDEIREALSNAITHDTKEFYVALGRVAQEVKDGGDSPLVDVVYADVFNPKVEALLADPGFRDKIANYIEKYDDLVSESTFFQKGVFTHNNAADVAKSLKQNGFFKAAHSVYLRIDGKKTEISTEKELESAIQAEKNRILTDKELRSAFDEIDKLLTKNAESRKFRTCLETNPAILPELANPERLRQKLWIAYLIRQRDRFNEVLDAYNRGKAEIASIMEEAKREHTQWADVIRIFNERFSVPFVVQMENQVDVILKSVAPSIRFDFLEDAEDKDSPTAAVEKDTLMRLLSSGEKRALYILNIIFEVEARKAARVATLFIVDDIADSFDYKNKYAIIEYLKDVSREGLFQQIILSHNFSFFRTVASRLYLKCACRMLAHKTSEEVSLTAEAYQDSAPFSHWRKHLADKTMLMASIPFLRNLAEFSGDTGSRDRLTSLLHVTPDSRQITIADLEKLVKDILRDNATLSLRDPESAVMDVIHCAADEIAREDLEDYALEKKVVLSIAIRLKAEEFMLLKIGDDTFWREIRKNQTVRLMERFKSDFPGEKECIEVLERVNLMTPENIHLNSFMYEPILDLSALHLKRLYLQLCDMQQEE